ncbi:SGNH/GDSL hydrolase family protein [Smaragdicoccus niigatensis]|uniref:SGNH/GDSL hydrolase family protein n=1 Tax=Smaragdicoccus niigatensis TaxID=359359 RepID=UPI0003698BCD|nr:SGNH/GDSL hydrolase family protein [Smaragdicoccus niigatensis]
MTIKLPRIGPDGRRRGAWILLLVVTAIILATVTSMAMTPCTSRPGDGGVKVALSDGRALRVLYIGDSLSYGLYASSADKGFRQRMNAEFTKVHSVDAKAVGAVAYTASTIDLGTIGGNWDLAVVEQGTNDTGRSSLDTFRNDYAKLLDAVLAHSPLVQLVCLGVWTEPRFAQYYDRIIESECLSRGGTFRPLSDLFDNPENRGPAGLARFGGTSDNFHPNDLGHERISARLRGAIILTDGRQPWYRALFTRLRGCSI